MSPAAKVLRLAPGLDLPLDFATQGVVVIGVRGSGKSNTEVRFAELLFGVEIPFVAIDPKGDWYGIRMDGTSPGLPVPVFGGLYGDFPLDESLGARIANLLVDENLSAVLDVSRLSHGARARFLTDFFHQLMDRHQVEPHARCVIFEEAHRYIPQNVKGNQAELKEAAAAVLLEGRSFGLGCWACTQRPARLHNDVLEEVDTAIIHRIGLTATADLKRVRDWVKHEDLSDEISPSLTKLAAGEAWILAPVSLGIVQRTQIDRRTTFDSGATPVVGSASVIKRRQSTMADIDAPAIKEALADAIDKAKTNDPKELRRRIGALEKELAVRPTEKVVEVPAIPQQTFDALMVATTKLAEATGPVYELVAAIREELARILDGVEAVLYQGGRHDRQDLPRARPAGDGAGSVGEHAAVRGSAVVDVVASKASRRAAQRDDPPGGRDDRRPAVPGAEAPDGAVSGPRRRILDTLAWFESIGLSRVAKAQLALFADASPKSSSYSNNLGALRSAALIDYPAGGYVSLTPAGADIAAPSSQITTTAELLDALTARLPGPQMRIVRALVDAHPDAIDRVELAEITAASAASSSYSNNLGALRTLGLVDYPTKGFVAATDVLFLEAP